MAREGGLGEAKVDDLTTLALGAARAESGAADRLWAAVRPRLCRIALAIGVPPDDVPDLVQDVILEAHRHLRTFDPRKGTVDVWLTAVLVRRARNARRAEGRRRRMVRRFGAYFERAARPHPIDAVEARLTLARLLDVLTDGQREVVALYEIGGLTAEDASRLLGITAAGVRSIARDARIRLGEAAAGGRSSQEVRR